ncbi:MAG: MarR family transcriptional regulator [Candidatus Aureabacteria bacterium]|nr:MarR family transcriptional regulator [Candidatus Auribacterota bacterium]
MDTSSVQEFTDEVNEIIPCLIRIFGRTQAKQLCRGKITFPQFFILDYLSKTGESTMTGLATFMSVTTPAMTGMVTRLVDSGYCQRAYDAGDRRIIRMRLTPRGHGIVRKVNAERRRMIVDVFGGLSARERARYVRLLRHVHRTVAVEKKG